jgi:hypothetical protein
MKSFKLTINEQRKTNTIYMLLDEVDELQIQDRIAQTLFKFM